MMAAVPRPDRTPKGLAARRCDARPFEGHKEPFGIFRKKQILHRAEH